MRKIEEILDQYAGRVNRQLEICLPDESSPPETLHQAMRYAVLGNGKRIRPVLLYATGEALGVPSERLDNPACAVELIHSYSLVHDDLPAMDDDDLRRGRPTCHKAFDEATAILVGDAVQALAFSMLANDQANSPEQRNTMIQLLAECTGSQGMVGGQAIDLASVDRQLSRQEVEHMHRLKTGALIKASVLLAVIASGADDPDTHNHFARFAECIGLMFQIRDDILDIQSNTETLGKPQGSDEAQKKPTYPSIIGIEESESACRELLEQACLEMESVNVRWDTLKLISRYIVTRAS
ncbi:MAG: polyprenyl synthetase family protein [Gammaproteobacteria bacterium]|nr:polyprenyl synthetase family protein [Gammaproteobacteria bacterium]